jgi:integrase/recombinase XerD
VDAEQSLALGMPGREFNVGGFAGRGRLGRAARAPWLGDRVEPPVGPLFCIIDGPTRGRSWSSSGVRVEFHRLAVQAGLRRRFAPHQLRHAHAVELAREGVALNVIQRQLGHANLGTTSIYMQGIDTEEIIATVHARRAPIMSATAGLQL